MALKSELPVLPVVVFQEGIDEPRHCSHVLQHSKPCEQSPRESRGGMHTIQNARARYLYVDSSRNEE